MSGGQLVLEFVYFAMGSACGTVRSALNPRRPNSVCTESTGTSFAYEIIIHGDEVQDTGDYGISVMLTLVLPIPCFNNI